MKFFKNHKIKTLSFLIIVLPQPHPSRVSTPPLLRLNPPPFLIIVLPQSHPSPVSIPPSPLSTPPFPRLLVYTLLSWTARNHFPHISNKSTHEVSSWDLLRKSNFVNGFNLAKTFLRVEVEYPGSCGEGYCVVCLNLSTVLTFLRVEVEYPGSCGGGYGDEPLR